MIRFPLPSLLSNDESCSLKTHFVKGRRDKKTMKINKNQPVLSQSTAVLNFPTFISQGCNCRTAAAPNPCSKSWVERGSLGAALKQKWYFSFMLLRRDAMLSPPQGQRGEVTSSPPLPPMAFPCRASTPVLVLGHGGAEFGAAGHV